MNVVESVRHYSPLEEKINVYSHALGFVLSVIALVLLLKVAVPMGSAIHIIAVGVFGFSLIILYAASSIYHYQQAPLLRSRLRIFDHAAIYILIAGTYTPFCLITLNGPLGWTIFSVCWTMAFIGIVLKIFFTGKYDLLSTLMYVFMGWMIVFAIGPLKENLSADGLLWLVAGGIAYTVGAILYAIKRIKFNHAIFHVFVLMGSACHFVSVYCYVLPHS